jgi:hypothetical protein
LKEVYAKATPGSAMSR